MKVTTNRLALGLTALMGAVLAAPEAQATPAFARQMEMNCMSCHTQAIPMLNSFGRHFKLTGFSMTKGDKSMITGGILGTSVPLAINAGVGVKSSYLDRSAPVNNIPTNQSPSNRDDLAIPGGSAIIIGGKIAEDAGINTLWNGDGLIHLQTTFAKPVGAGRAGFSIYGTQGHGPFISTESYNTGLHKELAMFDNPARTNAAQATGLGSGPASGVSAFYGSNGLIVTGALWVKGFSTNYSNGGLDIENSHSSLYRIAYDLPEMAAWNISIGAFGLNGSTTGTLRTMFENTPLGSAPWANTTTGAPDFSPSLAPNAAVPMATVRTKAHGFDLQAVGSIAGMGSQVLVSHVGNWELDFTNPNSGAYITGAPRQDYKATSVEAQVMPVDRFGIRAGYMTLRNNDNNTTGYKTRSMGVVYNYADNVRFSVEQSRIDMNAGTGDFKETLLQALLAF